MPFFSKRLIKIFQFFHGCASVISKIDETSSNSTVVFSDHFHTGKCMNHSFPLLGIVLYHRVCEVPWICLVPSLIDEKLYSKLCIVKREMTPLPFPRMYYNIIDNTIK